MATVPGLTMADPVTLVASIDTEEDNWRPVRSGMTANNIGELPRLQGHLEGLGLRPTYFTTYQVACDPRASRIIREIHDSGRAEIGAHLHPWNTPPLDEAFIPRNTMLSNLPRELQVEKIRAVTAALEACLGVRPYAFRAGRWGFGTKTAGALLECGYRVDSSITPFKSWAAYDEGPRHEGAPLGIYRLDGRGDTRVPVADGRLVEVPLSWGYDRRWGLWGGPSTHSPLRRSGQWRLGLLRAAARLHLLDQIQLSPEIESVADMLVLSRRLLEIGVRHLHVSWHSPSLVPGLSPFTRTPAQVEGLYAAISRYVEGLAAITSFTPQTVSEVAERLAPPIEASPPAVTSPAAATLEGRRLVVVSYHFPPDPAIGGQRWAGLTKYLLSWRWRSWVVTAAPPAPATGGVTVVTCPRRRTLNDVWRAWRSQTAAAGGDRGTEPSGGARRPSWWSRLRLDAAILLGFPDAGRGWILRAAWTTRRELARLKPDLLVSSGPPHSAHLAAWLARLGRRVRWIVDLRDPWAGPITGAWLEHPFTRSALARWLVARLERLVIRSADAVLCNTVQLAGALRSNYPGVRVDWLPNGVDHAQLPPRPAERFPGLAIAYVGTIYGGRNLSLLLRALRDFLDAHPAARAEGTRLRIAGHVESEPATLLEREIAALGLQASVDILGVLPRPEALDLVSRSGLALVLAQQQEYQVPAKLYELIGLGVPTVVVAEEGSAAGSEAVRLGAWRVDEQDVAGLTTILVAAWRGVGGMSQGSAERVAYMAIAADADQVLRGNPGGGGDRQPSSRELELTVGSSPGT